MSKRILGFRAVRRAGTVRTVVEPPPTHKRHNIAPHAPHNVLRTSSHTLAHSKRVRRGWAWACSRHIIGGAPVYTCAAQQSAGR